MTEAALLAAILDAPEDDAPRLIYSDWLDEQGQGERAEFIRVQCEAERLDRIVMSGIFTPGPPSNAPNTSKEFSLLCALRRRERELRPLTTQAFHEFGWPSGVSWVAYQPVFRRGFVHSITLSAADWMMHADKIIAPVPLPEVILPSWQPVEEVTLTTWPTLSMDVRLLGDRLAMEAGPPPWIRLTPEEVHITLLRRHWSRIKKWTLPPEYDVGPLADAAMETDFIRRCMLTRDQGRSSRLGRPSVPQVLPLVQEYYQMEGNGAGGSLHIVLEDQNIDSVEWCRGWAEEHHDLAGMALAGVLAEMTATQVGELATHPQKRGRTAAEDVPAGQFIQFDVQGRVRRSRP